MEACLARTKKELDDLHKEKKQLLLSSQEREITITVCNIYINLELYTTLLSGERDYNNSM